MSTSSQSTHDLLMHAQSVAEKLSAAASIAPYEITANRHRGGLVRLHFEQPEHALRFAVDMGAQLRTYPVIRENTVRLDTVVTGVLEGVTWTGWAHGPLPAGDDQRETITTPDGVTFYRVGYDPEKHETLWALTPTPGVPQQVMARESELTAEAREPAAVDEPPAPPAPPAAPTGREAAERLAAARAGVDASAAAPTEVLPLADLRAGITAARGGAR